MFERVYARKHCIIMSNTAFNFTFNFSHSFFFIFLWHVVVSITQSTQFAYCLNKLCANQSRENIKNI